MTSETGELIAVLDAGELGSRRPIGIVRARPGRRRLISFEYARSWLEWPGTFDIDPSLPLVAGETFVPDGLLPGVLSDTAPDRWGRRLLERREAAVARDHGRSVRSLDEWDFLVGVSDDTRMGAIRLGQTADGPFLDRTAGIPPLARLRSLEFAAAEVERLPNAPITDPTIALLIAPGSSLGGSRPKANFADEEGGLWIAKFPSRQDRRDVGRWEHLIMVLAKDAGIAVPEFRSVFQSEGGATFAARRFDRDGGGRRLYASGMTLAGRHDGDEASYLDLAVAIADRVDPGAIEEDLAQLFRRLVFNVMVGNRDDHLRNHGFLRTASGWRLSPAFDLNPSPEFAEHSLAIDESSHEPDLHAAVATCAFYRLSNAEAGRIVEDVAAAVATWADRARSLGLPGDEIDLMTSVIPEQAR